MIVSVAGLADFADFAEIQKAVTTLMVLSPANEVAGLTVSYSSAG